MKLKLLIVTAMLAGPAFGGTPTYTAPPPAPYSQPGLWNWFIGGSAGYLVDAEEWMFSGHVGVDTPWNLGGWNVAMFGEFGYTQLDNSFEVYNTSPRGLVTSERVKIETEVMPLTFNFKLERPLTGALNAYFGAGLGVAFIDVKSRSASGLNNYSDDDTVFAGQVFAGLVYNVSEAFEIYGGARWIYTDSTSIWGRDVDFDDDVLFELGLRVNF